MYNTGTDVWGCMLLIVCLSSGGYTGRDSESATMLPSGGATCDCQFWLEATSGVLHAGLRQIRLPARGKLRTLQIYYVLLPPTSLCGDTIATCFRTVKTIVQPTDPPIQATNTDSKLKPSLSLCPDDVALFSSCCTPLTPYISPPLPSYQCPSRTFINVLSQLTANSKLMIC